MQELVKYCGFAPWFWVVDFFLLDLFLYEVAFLAHSLDMELVLFFVDQLFGLEDLVCDPLDLLEVILDLCTQI